MSLNINQLNQRLDANQKVQEFGDLAKGASKTFQENTFAKNATLVGNKAGEVVGGIESLESKIDNAGSAVMGDAMCSIKDGVSGLSGVPDPQSIDLDLSVPTFTLGTEAATDSGGVINTITAGATENQSVSSVVQQLTGLGAPVAKLETETLGASSLDAIDATASDMEGKSNALKSKIQSVASEVKAASGTGGGASGGLGAVTDKLKKAEGMLEKVTQEISAVPSLNANAPDLSNVTNDVGSVTSSLKNAVNNIKTSASDLANEVTSGISESLNEFEQNQKELGGFFDKNPIKTGLGLLQDIAEDITNDVTAIVRGFTSNAKLPKGKVSNIVSSALDGTKEGLAKATQETIKNDTTLSPQMKVVIGTIDDGLTTDEFVKEVGVKANAANIPADEVEAVQQRVFLTEEELSKIDTTISGSLITSADSFVVEDFDLSDTLKLFDGERTQFENFTYIDSKEELGTEFRVIKRPITEMIVHASETYTNQNIGCEELHVEHNQLGKDGIQYHLVIRRDGKLQRGRPIDKKTSIEHANGHGENAIEVCLVGGLNCATGCDNPEEYRSPQSFTREQMTTLESVCEAFYRRYHGGQVFGHNEIQPLVSDPYFNVSEYVETVFRKVSVYEDPAKDTALSPNALITKKPL